MKELPMESVGDEVGGRPPYVNEYNPGKHAAPFREEAGSR